MSLLKCQSLCLCLINWTFLFFGTTFETLDLNTVKSFIQNATFKKLFCLMKLKVIPFAITWAENWPLLTKQVQIYYLSTTKWVLKYWTDSSPMEPRFGWRLWPQFWQMKRLGWWDHSVVEKGTTFPYYSSTKRVRPEWNCHSMTFHTFAWQILWHQGFSLHFFCGGND